MTTPSAQPQVKIAGGAFTTGAIEPVAASASVHLELVNTAGLDSVRWEWNDYPEGWTAPAGWSTAADGTIFYVGFSPPDFTLPAITLWGKFALRVTGYYQQLTQTIVDESMQLSMIGPFGEIDLCSREFEHFTTATTRTRRWVRSVQRMIRALTGIRQSLALAADFTNAATSPTTALTATPFLFPVKNAVSYKVAIALTGSSSGTGGFKLTTTGPVGTTIQGWWDGFAAVVATRVPQEITALGAMGSAVATIGANTRGEIRGTLVFTAGADGFFGLSVANVTATQTTTIKARSSIEWSRVVLQ